MILTCPECATRYQTDAAQFMPDGRKVRCARCGHVWFQSPPAPEPEMPAVAEEQGGELVAESAAPQRTAYAPAVAGDAELSAVAQPRPRRMERLGLALGWAALAGMFVAAGWYGLRYRQDIATLWPQSSSLYAAVGMRVNTRGIEFHDRDAHFESQDGQNVLVISGHLVNITSHELTVPPIRVSLSDGARRELYHWSFSSGVATLAPGETAAFHTRLPSPPSAARDIELRFAERSN